MKSRPGERFTDTDRIHLKKPRPSTATCRLSSWQIVISVAFGVGARPAEPVDDAEDEALGDGHHGPGGEDGEGGVGHLGPGQESQTIPRGERRCWREARARERPWGAVR